MGAHRDMQDAAGTGPSLQLPLERPEQPVADGGRRAAQQQPRALAGRRRPLGRRPQRHELVRGAGRVRRNQVLQDCRLDGAPALRATGGVKLSIWDYADGSLLWHSDADGQSVAKPARRVHGARDQRSWTNMAQGTMAKPA